MKPPVLVALLLVAAGAAAAQPGPDPGHDSALDYAADYVSRQAEAAASDPLGTAANKTSPEGAQAEAAHALYVACWAADDAGVQPDACAAYYTPRGKAEPDQPHEHDGDEARNATASYLDQTANGTVALAGNVTAFLNETLEDPRNATDHAGRLVDSAVAFVEDVLGGAAELALLLADGLTGCLGGLADGLGVATGGVGSLGGHLWGGLSDGLGLALDGVGLGAQGVGAGLAGLGHGVLAVVGAVGTGATATVDAAGDLAGGLADGLTDAAAGTAEAASTAASATGDVLVDAARAVGDAVDRIFGHGTAPGGDLDGAPDLDLDDPVDADGLLDGVTGLLER